MNSVYELQADLCKVFSNARRLEIINHLKGRELSSNELMAATGLSKVSLFQHLNVLKAKGILITRREGNAHHYRIADDRIIEACSLMRAILMDQLQEKGKRAADLTAKIRKHTR